MLTFLYQYFMNYANLADHALNTILLGDPSETVSARIARAKKAGKQWAAIACNILTFLSRVLTFNQSRMNHCDYALDVGVLPSGKELWDWTLGKFDDVVVTEAVEIGANGVLDVSNTVVNTYHI